jgi:hypothetical protein
MEAIKMMTIFAKCGGSSYNPSYSEVRDWEDHSSRPAQAKSSRDPLSINGWVWW